MDQSEPTNEDFTQVAFDVVQRATGGEAQAKALIDFGNIEYIDVKAVALLHARSKRV